MMREGLCIGGPLNGRVMQSEHRDIVAPGPFPLRRVMDRPTASDAIGTIERTVYRFEEFSAPGDVGVDRLGFWIPESMSIGAAMKMLVTSYSEKNDNGKADRQSPQRSAG